MSSTRTMLAKTRTGTVRGVDGLLVKVEVDASKGLTRYRTVGLPDAAVREAEVRVRSSLANSGFPFPEGTVTVNLAPADVKKQGSAFDLAVALGVVAVARRQAPPVLEETLFLGELALDGTVRSVRGVLPIVCEAARRHVPRVVVPRENADEAALVEGISVFPVGSLREAIDRLDSDWASPHVPASSPPRRPSAARDLVDVRGQRQAKRALEIAAAGGHNLLFVGPPGAGKSLLAACLPALLPHLAFDQALEVTKIYSVAGLLDDGVLAASPPFRAPHHTVSAAAMVGGGSGLLPGEVSLAHHGVLFLDELAEFMRPALECLRQPLEDGRVRIRRVDRMASFPARFTLVAAMNPCPCGFLGAASRPCECTPGMIQRYQGRISGPLLDRIDMRVAVRAVKSEELLTESTSESSDAVRARVLRARRAQAKRVRGGRLNAFLTPRQIGRHCRTDDASRELLEQAVDRFGLSARGFHRVLKVARTIADLAGDETVSPEHVSEALHFRVQGRGSEGT